ncbi:hypothetical protein [Mucilaginibacter endophyticus]|uniref:hypothetical protein n=1 Tax=Mucilaginibacter endophyticus TaxID=2675003 RepID=UPI0012B17F39|nr:hypothetical protein [Mucilaginibacter endophyticus]
MTNINALSYPKSILINCTTSIFVLSAILLIGKPAVLKMKKNGGLKKIAVRVNGNTDPVYTTLAASVIGSKKVLIAPGLTAHWLPDGTIMELYGPGAVYPPYLFAGSDVVVSYKVEDIDQAVVELRRKGAEIITPIQQVHQTFRFCHIRAAGQSLFGIFEENER